MKQTIIFILSLGYTISAFGQDCRCPIERIGNELIKANKTFTLGYHLIGACGYFEVARKDTVSGFTLFECGKSNVIDEWGEITTCILRQKKDTIVVEEMEELSIGKNFESILAPFYISKFYYDENNLLARINYFRKDLPKYSGKQIKMVLDTYSSTLLVKRDNYDTLILIAQQLFWAYVSGSTQAEQYLITFDKKFGPFDGAIAEEWDDIIAIYELYKGNKKKRYNRG